MQTATINTQRNQTAQQAVASMGTGCQACRTTLTASSADTRGSCDPDGMLASFSAITCESSMLARLPLSAAMPHRSTLTSRGLADAEPDVDAPAVQCRCTGAAEHLSLLTQTGPFDVLSGKGLQSSSCSPSCAKLTRRKGFRHTLLVSKMEGNCTICQQEQTGRDSHEEIAILMCTNDVELGILCFRNVEDN